jgi:hypothetical protein
LSVPKGEWLKNIYDTEFSPHNVGEYENNRGTPLYSRENQVIPRYAPEGGEGGWEIRRDARVVEV